VFCPRCGTQNDDRAVQCQRCASPLQPAGAPPPPPPGAQQGWGQPPPAYAYPQRPNVPNYLVQSILVTLFCCLPFGIVSIVYASQVNGKLDRGDVAGAMVASGKAKKWSWVSFGIGLGLGILGIIGNVIGAMSGSH
jgi:hypothetical protein